MNIKRKKKGGRVFPCQVAALNSGAETYFDLQQNNLSLEHTYSNIPVPKDIDESKKEVIQGIHASLWSEVIPNVNRLEYMAFPRGLAFAETAWSPESSKDWAGFSKRIISHYKRMDAMGVRYRMPDLSGFIENNKYVGQGKLVVNQPLAGTIVRYTHDGSEPDESSPVYSSPILVESPMKFRIAYYRPGGELFDVYTAEFTDAGKFLEGVSVTPEGKGLRCQYYKGNDEHLISDYIAGTIRLPDDCDTHFTVHYTGYFKAPEDGIYTFYLTSDDGSWLYIGDKLLIDNGGSHKTIQKRAQTALAKGYHKIHLKYYETGYDVNLQLHYSINGSEVQEISNKYLYY